MFHVKHLKEHYNLQKRIIEHMFHVKHTINYKSFTYALRRL